MRKVLIAVALVCSGCASQMMVADDGGNPNLPRGGIIDYRRDYPNGRQSALSKASAYCPNGFQITSEGPRYGAWEERFTYSMHFVCKS